MQKEKDYPVFFDIAGRSSNNTSVRGRFLNVCEGREKLGRQNYGSYSWCTTGSKNNSAAIPGGTVFVLLFYQLSLHVDIHSSISQIFCTVASTKF